MGSFQKIKVPERGEKIIVKDNQLQVPDEPIIPFIEGDGIGPDIWRASKRVMDAAVEKAYNGKKKISWMEIYAGDKAKELYGEYLPEETFDAIREYIVAIKGPLTTPVGGGFRSLNVTLRQVLDLYACIRPVKYIPGVPSPVRNPDPIDFVIFRENTEDVYAGIEFEHGTKENEDLRKFLEDRFQLKFHNVTGLGIKPISEFASKRLIRKAIQYAIDNNRKSVTLVHKGNIQKYTEGAFMRWGYELAEEEFKDVIVTEKELYEKYDGKTPEGKIILKDRIADNMFQQVLLRPAEYDVIATTNLNGDYLSDALAAQAGGLGMAPGANVGDFVAIFEATHGTAPKYKGMDKVNPGSLLLSGVLMLEYLGWKEPAHLIKEAFARTIQQKIVTYDLARQLENAKEVKTSQFADAIINNL